MKNVFSAVICVLALALSLTSCNGGPEGIADNNTGTNQQTNASTLTYHGIIVGQFIDHPMIPVARIGEGDTVWAYFADSDYKMAVYANQAVAAGNVVMVTMRIVRNHDIDYLRIVEVKVILAHMATTGVPVPVVTNSDSGHLPTIIKKYTPKAQPKFKAKASTEKCCCSTNITIYGNSASIITGNTNNTPGTVPLGSSNGSGSGITKPKADSLSLPKNKFQAPYITQ